MSSLAKQILILLDISRMQKLNGLCLVSRLTKICTKFTNSENSFLAYWLLSNVGYNLLLLIDQLLLILCSLSPVSPFSIVATADALHTTTINCSCSQQSTMNKSIISFIAEHFPLSCF